MSTRPNWLTTLQRVREHRRDAALQSLAHSLRAAADVRDITKRVVETISSLREAQQQTGSTGLLAADRLRQLRRDRDDRQSQLIELQRRQCEAGIVVQQAQSLAAEKESDVEVLRRLGKRLLTAQQQELRRHSEQTVLEAALALCNEQPCD